MNDIKQRYNPFNDSGLHTTQKDQQHLNDERAGFNDALNHYDIINGFRTTKHISGFPQRFRRFIRIFASIWVATFVVFMVYTFIATIIAIISG